MIRGTDLRWGLLWHICAEERMLVMCGQKISCGTGGYHLVGLGATANQIVPVDYITASEVLIAARHIPRATQLIKSVSISFGRSTLVCLHMPCMC